MYKLRQLVGKRAENGVVKTVAQDIDEVMIANEAKTLGWERLGFIDRRDGAHINFKAGLTDSEKQKAHAAVCDMRTKAYKYTTNGKYVAAVDLPSEVTSEPVEETEVDDE